MKKLLKIIVLLAPLSCLGVWSGNAYAAACTSAATGLWRTAATWAAPCNVAGGPTAADTVTIANTHNVTADSKITVGVVTVDSGGTLTIAGKGGTNFVVNGATNISGTLTHASTGGTETFTGLLTINAGGIWDNTLGEAVTFSGGITNNGTFTGGTGTQTFDTTQTIGGTSPINFGGIVDVANGVTVTNSNTNVVTIAGNLTGGNPSNWVNAANSTLNYGGVNTPMGARLLTATAAGNTVNYTGVAQIVKPTAYYHLGISGSGAATMTGVTAIGGDLSISGAATMTANGALTVAGTLNYSSTGITTLVAATPVSIGSLNLSAGTLIDNGNTITVTGTGTSTWTQAAGTFVPTGTVIFTGTAPQIGTSSFNNLTISVGAGNIATLTGNATVSGMLNLASGLVAAGTNTMEVTSNCATAISGGSATSYMLGNLRLYYPTNAGTTTCIFHIGDAAAYAPVAVAINNVSSALANSSLTARTDAGDHADTTAGASGIDATKSVNRFWTLTPGISLAFTTYDTIFTFAAGDIDAGAIPANFLIGRNNGVSWAYPVMGAKNPTDITATGVAQADGFGAFVIGERLMPSITVLKTVTAFSDPVNLLANPKFIPGAIGQYSLIASNSGGPADNDSTFIADPIPANTALYVNDIGGPGPVLFTQGAASSTLTYTFTALGDTTDDLSFSNDGGATWTAVPVPDAFGCDATITHIRVNPKGPFAGRTTAPNPGFLLTFRVCVK